MDSTANIQFSAEMAKFVLVTEAARNNDDIEYNKWKKSKDTAERTWNKLPKEEQEKKLLLGQGFIVGPIPLRRHTRAIRRQIRYKLFRICEGKWQDNTELTALKMWYEGQFQINWSWPQFTFDWDISAVEPLKIITPFEWDGAMLSEYVPGAGGKINGKYCDPPAFTNQHI